VPQRGIRWLPPGMAVPARTSGCLHGTVIGYPRALERAVPHGVVQRAQPRRIREPGHHSDEQRLRHHHRRKGPRPAPGDLCLETAVLIGRRGNGASDVAAMAALTQGEGGRVRRCRAGNAAGIVTVKSGPGTIHGSRKQGAFPFVGLPRPCRRSPESAKRPHLCCLWLPTESDSGDARSENRPAMVVPAGGEARCLQRQAVRHEFFFFVVSNEDDDFAVRKRLPVLLLQGSLRPLA